jgi:hypothetical protein
MFCYIVNTNCNGLNEILSSYSSEWIHMRGVYGDVIDVSIGESLLIKYGQRNEYGDGYHCMQ